MHNLSVRAKYYAGPSTFDFAFESTSRFTAIEGPSGAGKSTFLRIIAGLIRPKDATVTFNDTIWQNHAAFVPAWQRQTGWVPQDALLFPQLSVRENLTIASDAREQDTESVAQALGIAPLLNRLPRNLSGGERQRVALGRALLSKAPLLLLDEPFSALDRRLREKARSFVFDWAKEQTQSVVLVTHQPSDVQDWQAEHWLMEGGRLDRL